MPNSPLHHGHTHESMDYRVGKRRVSFVALDSSGQMLANFYTAFSLTS
jgi:hypothetical protein